MHTIGGRLKAWRGQAKLSQKDASTRFGVPSRTYQDYERDLKSPGSGAIERFVKAGINANWLLTGEGPMLLASVGQAREPSMAMTAEEGRAAGYIALPLCGAVRTASGCESVDGAAEKADEALMFKEDWIRYELGTVPQNLFLIRVSGDSMEPTLRAGDVILIDRSSSRPDREGIYIMRMGEMLLVKRLQALPGGRIRVISDNPAFEPWVVERVGSDNDVEIYGRVVWTGRRL